VPCPKAMAFGPCGGVGSDGGCEVDGHLCPFVSALAVPTIERTPLPLHLPLPTIIVDVVAPTHWNMEVRELWHQGADRLVGSVALIREDVVARRPRNEGRIRSTQQVIKLLQRAGVPSIATVTGRNRTVESARCHIGQLRDAGAVAIHCVTGDYPRASSNRSTVCFGAEAMTLAAAAVDEGVPATVAESPASPGFRAHRVKVKQQAGASLCLLNHGGDASNQISFADHCRAVGVTIPLVAPVPMVASKRSALALAGRPGVQLPHGFLDAIIDAVDPAAEGLLAAYIFMRELAASGRFDGINLSGSAVGASSTGQLSIADNFIRRAHQTWFGS
jgi:methylenetetrahydrofolate reductase (NADPH)